MNLKTLFAEEKRAVSPVIGVILMVAITVILAAVIGTFVLGLGQNVGNAAPQATLSVSATGDTSNATVTIEHNGGDALHLDRSRVLIQGSEFSISSTGSDGTLAVGESQSFHSTGNADGDWGTVSDWEGNSFSAESTDSVTIKIIDTESQKVIFETEVTAA